MTTITPRLCRQCFLLSLSPRSSLPQILQLPYPARFIHTSSRYSAQPLSERYWQNDDPPPPPSRPAQAIPLGPLPGAAGPSSSSIPLIRHRRTSRGDEPPTEPEDIPNDADFTGLSDVQNITDPLFDPSLGSKAPTQLPPSLSTSPYDDRLINRARRNFKRRTTASDPPALLVSEMPEDGMTRFDWRQRSLSRTGRARGLKWFPGLNRKRVEAMTKELLPGEALYDEVARYQMQYVS